LAVILFGGGSVGPVFWRKRGLAVSFVLGFLGGGSTGLGGDTGFSGGVDGLTFFAGRPDGLGGLTISSSSIGGALDGFTELLALGFLVGGNPLGLRGALLGLTVGSLGNGGPALGRSFLMDAGIPSVLGLLGVVSIGLGVGPATILTSSFLGKLPLPRLAFS